ncbi:porin [Candidatus Pelagibacter sp.]|nr:porin [Candidatus Pelagibacter sp.]
MNIKKIGMTALAASLVSVSANAVDMTVSGGASINANQYSGTNLDYGSSFTMGNALTFSASGETESGLNVSVSFELDEGSNSGNKTAVTDAAGDAVSARNAPNSSDVFDNHSVSVGNDTLGTLIFSGHGGNSATTKINTTAAGDIWDAFDGALMSTVATGVGISEAGAGDDSFFYTAPSLMDGLDIFASYNPSSTTSTDESAMGYGATYTGVDGLTLSYAQADVKTNSSATSGENTAISAKYAYGPVTVAYTINEHDEGTNTNDQDTTSYAVSYTLTEEISVSYGVEELERGGAAAADAEYSKISASYTSGGVTLSAAYSEADNIDYSNNANADQEYIFLGASFAF